MAEQISTVVFSRKLPHLDTTDPAIKQIERHINFMQEQSEFTITKLKRRITELEDRVAELEG